MLPYAISLGITEKYNKSAAVQVLQVFGTPEHIDSRGVF